MNSEKNGGKGLGIFFLTLDGEDLKYTAYPSSGL